MQKYLSFATIGNLVLIICEISLICVTESK